MNWQFGNFEYPSTWYDEKTVYGLYQRFKRSRDADPIAYNQKLSFWSVLIQDYCNHKHLVIISESSLKQQFGRYLKCTGKSHEPDCLGTVLWEMLNTPSTLRPLSDFSMMGKVSTLLGTGYDWFVKKPVSWSWNFITGSRTREKAVKTIENDNLDFVLLSTVNKMSEEFFKWLGSNQFSQLRPSQELNILRKSHYEEALNSFFPDEKSRDFMRSWFQQHGFTVSFKDDINSQSIEVVKFNSGRISDAPVEFGDDDRSFLVVIQLKDVIEKLEREASQLQVSLDERKSAVRALVHEKKKSEALRLLRRGKVIERSLEQKHMQIEKVESLLLQIESSKGNRHLIGALSVANKAMKDALGDSRDSLEDTIADLHDTYDQQQEVNSVLSDMANFTLDGDDLEAELNELLSGSGGVAGGKDRRYFPSVDPVDIDKELAELDLSLELPDVSNLPIPNMSDARDAPSSSVKKEGLLS